MHLKKLEWRNIGPYGNRMQELEFSEDGGLWMVLGKNGHGKSFLVNLPKILYYGKLDKFKKEDIANRLNKHGFIKGTVQVNPGTEVIIERNLAPSDLTVFRNGEDIGKAGIANYQDYLDVEVTGLPYHIFSNIISLSVNDFKSFILMSPHDKRIIIDKLFAMEIINKMNDIVKKKLRALKIDLSGYDREIKSLFDSITSAQKELERLKKEIQEDNTKKVSEIQEKLKIYNEKAKEAQSKLTEMQNKEAEIKKSYDTFIHQKGQVEYALKAINKKIALYNQDQCPTCATPFTDKRFELLKGDLQEKLKQRQDQEKVILENETKYTGAFQKVRENISRLNKFIIETSAAYNTLNMELNALNAEHHSPKELKSIKNIISKNTSTIQSKETKKSEIDTDLQFNAILEELYSDAGVKKKILESYLPTLNKEIEYTLNELHFPYRLNFNNDFEPQLQHLGIDINVGTLSTGEQKRVDLAVLISIIRMLKRKFPSLNIFMLDEVLSSIDSDGIYDIIGLLNKTAKELAINIFIINHSPLPIEHFDYRIEIAKNDGFSELKMEKLGDENELGEY